MFHVIMSIIMILYQNGKDKDQVVGLLCQLSCMSATNEYCNIHVIFRTPAPH